MASLSEAYSSLTSRVQSEAFSYFTKNFDDTAESREAFISQCLSNVISQVITSAGLSGGILQYVGTDKEPMLISQMSSVNISSIISQTRVGINRTPVSTETSGSNSSSDAIFSTPPSTLEEAYQIIYTSVQKTLGSTYTEVNPANLRSLLTALGLAQDDSVYTKEWNAEQKEIYIANAVNKIINTVMSENHIGGTVENYISPDYPVHIVNAKSKMEALKLQEGEYSQAYLTAREEYSALVDTLTKATLITSNIANMSYSDLISYYTVNQSVLGITDEQLASMKAAYSNSYLGSEYEGLNETAIAEMLRGIKLTDYQWKVLASSLIREPPLKS